MDSRIHPTFRAICNSSTFVSFLCLLNQRGVAASRAQLYYSGVVPLMLRSRPNPHIHTATHEYEMKVPIFTMVSALVSPQSTRNQWRIAWKGRMIIIFFPSVDAVNPSWELFELCHLLMIAIIFVPRFRPPLKGGETLAIQLSLVGRPIQVSVDSFSWLWLWVLLGKWITMGNTMRNFFSACLAWDFTWTEVVILIMYVQENQVKHWSPKSPRNSCTFAPTLTLMSENACVSISDSVVNVVRSLSRIMLDDGRFPVDFNGKCSLLTLTSSFTTSPIIYSKKLLAGSEGSDCSSLQDQYNKGKSNWLKPSDASKGVHWLNLCFSFGRSRSWWNRIHVTANKSSCSYMSSLCSQLLSILTQPVFPPYTTAFSS